MAKKAAERKNETPANLEMSLFAPGMSLLHRAGLGGLACTLNYIERKAKRGQLKPDQLPGGPWPNGKPPWTIEPHRIVLEFGEPKTAAEFLKRLFVIAFQVQNGLMFLPGQYLDNPPSDEVRAYLQQGCTLTFLQHGKTRSLAKTETVKQYEADGKQVTIAFKECSDFKHQEGWKELVDPKTSCVSNKPGEVVGPLSPGAVVRHVAFTSQTKIEETPDRLLPLYFALVGCLALPINRGCGVLIVPEVEDLEEFISTRPEMTPTSARDCQITSAGDAALQAQARLKKKSASEAEEKVTPKKSVPRPMTQAGRTQVELAAAHIAGQHLLPGCHTSVFQPTPWASQQKSRVQTLLVQPSNEAHMARLETFEVALAVLSPKVVTRVVKESQGRGKQKVETQREESFWSDSVVRPLVADNLARGRPWYEGFASLMTRIDPVSKKPVRDRLGFEKEGLHKMTEQLKEPGESAVVRAIHDAIRRRYAMIADENQKNPVAMRNRWKGEYDRWRLAFAGAKTADQFRLSLCDLFSRAGTNSVLQTEWPAVLPLMKNHWQLTRDLALLGLASYSGKGTDGGDESGKSATK